MAYLDLDVSPLSADEVTDTAIAQLQFLFPGWQPADGDLLTWIASTLGFNVAELSELIGTASQSLFRSIGQTLHGIPAQEATEATGKANFALTDAAPHILPSGTQIVVGGIAFETTADGTNDTGEAEILDVPIQAIEAGAAGSGLAGDAELLDLVAFVAAVTVQAVTINGVDAETDDVYQARLASLLALSSPMPILPRDFVRYALTVPSVGRAVALDLYDADTATPDVAGHMTVAIAGTDGLVVSPGVKIAVNALFNDPDTGRRGLTQVVHVIDHGYNAVDVTFGVRALPGWNTGQVEDAVVDALTEFFSPINWGRIDQGEEPFYVNRPVVRIFDVATAINEVEGVDYVETLQQGLDGGSQIGSNLTLTGGGSPAPLPTPGAITGTVTAP